MRDNIFLSICVLTDPASANVKGKKRNNLSLKHLTKLIPTQDSSLAHKVRQLLEGAKTSWEPFRNHRNRRIGHYDLDTVLKKKDQLLLNIEINDVDTALDFIADILNAVQTYYGPDKTTYHCGILCEGNAEELIELLQRNSDLEKYFNEKEFGDPVD